MNLQRLTSWISLMSSPQSQLKPKRPRYPCYLTEKPTDLKKITEAVYLKNYYEKQQDESGKSVSYEWNNGYLEIKPMSDYLTSLIHLWFLKLLSHYLQHSPCAKLTLLERGGKFKLSANEQVIRKPDLGLVLNSNPIALSNHDRHYQGCFDLCVETLSTSHISEIRRDTIQKKREYEQAGVQEYLILAHDPKYCEYYHLNAQEVYQPAQRDQEGVVRSGILPGFQWRMEDLYYQPDEMEMAALPVYQNYVAIAYQHEKKARLKTEQQLADLKKSLTQP